MVQYLYEHEERRQQQRPRNPRGDVNRAVVAELETRGLVAEGDWLIITKGDFSGVKGGTNSMKIVKVGEVAGERD